MTQSKFSDISSLLNKIYEMAEFTLRQQNLLVPTVTVFNDTQSMVDRQNSSYSAASVRQVAEGEDVTSTQFTRSALSTLTPARYADQFFLTDERIRSDDQNVRADAALEMGMAFAQNVDEAIADQFSSLTAGTIGAAAGTIVWADIVKARALLHTAKVPGPFYCVLHPYQWMHLVNSAQATSAEIVGAPMFQDRIIQNYFVNTAYGDVIFVVTPSVNVDGNDDATGAMYARSALAYDERQPFTVELERDASRQGWEFNGNLHYATGTWNPARGVVVIGDAATPS